MAYSSSAGEERGGSAGPEGGGGPQPATGAVGDGGAWPPGRQLAKGGGGANGGRPSVVGDVRLRRGEERKSIAWGLVGPQGHGGFRCGTTHEGGKQRCTAPVAALWGGGIIGRRPDPEGGPCLRRSHEGGGAARGPAGRRAAASIAVGERKKGGGLRASRREGSSPQMERDIKRSHGGRSETCINPLLCSDTRQSGVRAARGVMGLGGGDGLWAATGAVGDGGARLAGRQLAIGGGGARGGRPGATGGDRLRRGGEQESIAGGSSGRKAAAGSAVGRRSREGGRGAQSLRQHSGGGGIIGRRPDPVDGSRLRRSQEGGSVAGGPAGQRVRGEHHCGRTQKH